MQQPSDPEWREVILYAARRDARAAICTPIVVLLGGTTRLTLLV